MNQPVQAGTFDSMLSECLASKIHSGIAVDMELVGQCYHTIANQLACPASQADDLHIVDIFTKIREIEQKLTHLDTKTASQQIFNAIYMH